MADFLGAVEEGNLNKVKYFIEQQNQNINEKIGYGV